MTGKNKVAGPWWIVSLLTLAFAINFIDRMVLANVAPVMLVQLHFSNEQYSFIVFAFMLGMTLGQVPVGTLIDRIGVRWGLAGTFASWSFANMGQALARSVFAFSGLRLLMGISEGGTYSAGVKSIGEILPNEQRAFALGIFNSGTLLGSVIAPPLVVYIERTLGWRQAFFLPSLAGLLWIPLWLRAWRVEYRESRSRKATPSASSMSMGNLLRLRQTWGVIGMRALSGPLSQFYWYFLPMYLVRARGLSMEAMAGLASMSYLVGGCGQLAAGYFSGLLIERGWDTDRARKVTYTLGTLVAGVCTLIAPVIKSSFSAAVVIAIANFGINVMSNHNMAVVTDVFPVTTLASVAGMTGMGEGIIDMVAMLLTGTVIDRFSWFPVFAAAGLMPIGAFASLFLLVRRCHRLSPEEVRPR